MLWLLAVVSICCFAILWRVAAMLRPIRYSYGDEKTYLDIAKAIALRGWGEYRRNAHNYIGNYRRTFHSPPCRVLWIALAAAACRLTRTPYRFLAWVATVCGAACVPLGAVVGLQVAGAQGAVAAAALMASSPLVLGLGRRALLDVPVLACQLAMVALVGAGVAWWPALVAVLVVGLLLKESIRTCFPALLVYAAWTWGAFSVTACAYALLVFGAGLSGWSLVLWRLTGHWPWEFRKTVREGCVKLHNEGWDDYGHNYCRGGPVRLLTDIWLISPAVFCAAIAAAAGSVQGPLLALAGGILILYGRPRLAHQIRTAALAESLARIVAAITVPFVTLPVLILVDVWRWHRIWWQGRLYDPSTSALSGALDYQPATKYVDDQIGDEEDPTDIPITLMTPWQLLGAMLFRSRRPAPATLCLNMIVRDEAAVIRRCLESCRSSISYWVIVDTGSTDGTQEIIRDAMAGIPGELHERPWRDFGHNRTEAIELAKGKASHILLMDADHVLKPGAMPLSDSAVEAYFVPITIGGKVYSIPRIVRDGLDWRFDIPTHEQLECGHRALALELADWSIDEYPDGHRRATGAKFDDDIRLLEGWLSLHPDSTRAMFYLARSYQDAGDYENAFRWYGQRVQAGGWKEEIFHSLLSMARLQEAGGDWLKAQQLYQAAYNVAPGRAEALVDLAVGNYDRGLFNLAELYADKAKTLPIPHDLLFVDRAAYAPQQPSN